LEVLVRLCSVENCPNKHFGKGFCPQHYHKWRRYGNPLYVIPLEQRGKKQSEAMKGRKISEEHKKKISEARKGMKLSEATKKKLSEAHKNPSKESRKRMSEAQKKRPKISEATRKKMSEAMTGKKMPKKSEATLKRMSESQKGKIPSEAQRKKQSEAMKGKKNSEAHNKKISEAMKGRQFSDEWRKKMSVARRKRITTEETKQKMAKTWSSPKYAEIARQNLRTARHNQVKPNNRESQIGQILTEAEIRFKFHRNIDYQTIENEHRKKEVDVFIRPKKIIEHNGTYNHADPRKYKPDDLIREHGKMVKASEIWKREKIILKQIKKQGYKILVIWEQDLLHDIENTKNKILKFAKS
jgi:hypothetical protein